ncbi:MAG: protein kinase [Myxococcales bacterium]|nr:protein kinase [Myxococcales bacterium]
MGGLAASTRMAAIRAALFGTPTAPIMVDRFVLLRPLGAGGMGEVFEAYDPRLDRRVALKLVSRDDACDERIRLLEARMGREAQAMARLSHPNVVQIHESGRWQGRVFLAMELIQGSTLTAWLREHPRSWREILAVFLDVGRGLAAAHAVGVIHRDFKPDNVLVGEDGRGKVTDFGLARYSSAAEGVNERGEKPAGVGAPLASVSLAAALTASGVVAGTPAYMSAERLRGHEATAASDQFSFCVALYEALYSDRPFTGDSTVTYATAVLEGALREQPRIGVPRRIHRALVRGLAVDPERRFPSMDALLSALAVRRSWPRLVGGAAILTAMLGAALALRGDACGDGSELLAGVWDERRRAAVAEVFASSTAPYADVLWSSSAAMLDRYADSIRDSYINGCVAHSRGALSAELHDLRVDCLRRRAEVVDAVVGELESAEDELLRALPKAVAGLEDVATCDDLRALRLGTRPPTVAERAALGALRRELGKVRAAELVGDLGEETSRRASALVDSARVIGYEPALAEALYQRGRLAFLSREIGVASELLREAGLLAVGAAHDTLVSELWAWRIQAEVAERPATAGPLLDEAEAWLRRRGATTSQRADVELARSSVLQAEGDLVGAAQASRSAMELRESVYGPEHLAVEIARLHHGSNLTGLGETDEAVELIERGLAGVRRAVGDEHMLVADAMYALSTALLQSKDPAALREASALLATADPIIVSLRGSEAIERADNDLAAAQVAYLSDERDVAGAHIDRALGLYRRYPERADRGYALSLLGELRRADGDEAGALRAFTAAREAFVTGAAPIDSIAQIDIELADALFEAGDYNGAVAHYVEGVDGLRQALGPKNASIAESYDELGARLLEQAPSCVDVARLLRLAPADSDDRFLVYLRGAGASCVVDG